MTAAADLVFNWAIAQFDIPASWCVPPAIVGPSYPHYINMDIWTELMHQYNGDKYIIGGTNYEFQVLPAQRKGGGRGAQGNMQLWRGGRMFMNLHISIHQNQNVVEAADVGDANQDPWIKPVRHKIAKK